MFGLRSLVHSILLLCLLFTSLSCALMETRPGPEVFYTIPPVTYLREYPGYASQIIATLYQAEQVTILSSITDNWRRVQTVAGGQVGWLQQPLLSAVPIRLEIYYLQVDEAPLRNEPHEEVLSRQILRRGDQVRKLSENQQGWWRVLVENDKSIGWLPAAAVAAQPPTERPSGAAGKSPGQADAGIGPVKKQAPKNTYFVAVAAMDLHLLPLLSSPVVKVLKFNEKVERVSQSGSAWLKVRYPETGAQGWALSRFLAESPVKAPKTFFPKKKKTPPKPKRHELKKDQHLQPEDPDPEVM
jgi:SH3-like domain-containing protein